MSEDYKLQLSVKIDGQHLFNIRGCNTEEFLKYVKEAVEYVELLQTATRALEGKAPAPAPATRQAPNAPQKAASQEFGPVKIVGVGKSSLKKDGTQMKSPKFTVEFSNGKKLSTFDTVVGQAAETLSGAQVYYSTQVNGEYTNLGSVRSA